jgi:hypothetical protein
LALLLKVGSKKIKMKSVDLKGFQENFYSFCCIYVHGIIDALSVHKTIPTLVNNTPALYIVLKIFGANILLIIGSELFFRKGILPFLDTVNDKVLDLSSGENNQYSSLLYLIYQSLWLVPICILCYVCSLTWYQELADCIDKYKKESTNKSDNKSSNALSSLQNTIYSLLTWLFAFIQVQILVQIIPAIINIGKYIITQALSYFENGSDTEDSVMKITASTSQITGFSLSLKGLIKHSLFTVLHLVKYSSLFAGFILMATLYAWYSFDPKWISEGKSAVERFALIEKYFFYFLGFGTPFVILVRCTSFFIGFGSFLIIFPFCIILGGVTDYSYHYKTYEVKDIIPVRIFKPAQVWTLLAFKMTGTGKELKTKLQIEKDTDGKKHV